MIKLTTNFGDIMIELNHEKAPKTCANFEQYVKDGFYDGTVFHRVINGFMVQGGGMNEDMSEKPTRENIENEANNGLKNNIGTLAMARTPDPHSASSQFFINVKDNDFLNFSSETANGWGYCVFAEVSEGMDVVDAIKNVATGNKGGHQDVPVESVIIESATIV
ncbi:MAG: peptidylprolyl isomerase [Pseudomonadota bacterium]